MKLQTLSEATKDPTEKIFTCGACGKDLKNPVETTSLYVMRDGPPMLIHPECALPTDLLIWGNQELIP